MSAETALGGVGVGGGGVAAAVGRLPDELTRPGLFEPPPRCLLGLVTSSARRTEAALTGDPALVVGAGVVVVGLHRGPGTDRVGAGLLADLDDVVQRGGDPVTRHRPGVGSFSCLDRADLEPGQPFRQALGVGWWWRWSSGAAVPDRTAVGVG